VRKRGRLVEEDGHNGRVSGYFRKIVRGSSFKFVHHHLGWFQVLAKIGRSSFSSKSSLTRYVHSHIRLPYVRNGSICNLRGHPYHRIRYSKFCAIPHRAVYWSVIIMDSGEERRERISACRQAPYHPPSPIL